MPEEAEQRKAGLESHVRRGKVEEGKAERREWMQGVFTMVTTRGQCGSS